MNTLYIARMTFLSFKKKYLLFFMISCSCFYVLFYSYFRSVIIGSSEKPLIDLTLSLQSLMVFLVCLLPVSLDLTSEIKDRKCYFLLSRNLSRENYLVGKFAGFLLCSTLFSFLISVFFSLFLLFSDSTGPSAIWKMVFPLFLKQSVWISLAVLFSISGNFVFTFFLTIFASFSGSFAHYLEYLASESVFFRILEKTLFFLPDLSVFNLSDAFIHHISVPSDWFFLITFYAFSCSSAGLTLAALFFRNKEL